MDENRPEVALPQLAFARESMAREIEAEAERLTRKMESVRAAMADDVAAMRRVRAQGEEALEQARLMAEQKRQAESLLEEKRGELRAALEAQELARETIERMTADVAERDRLLRQNAEALMAMEANWREASQAYSESEAEVGRLSLAFQEAQTRNARLDAQLFEREEAFALLERQLEMLGQESEARAGHIVVLENRLQQLSERFEEARKESHGLIMGLREGQIRDAQRTGDLETEGDNLRRRLHETERMRDRLTGQVDQLRAENAALRAEMQVRMRDLETLNSELAANVEVLERVLASSKPARDAIAPKDQVRPGIRLITEPKQRAGTAS